MKKRYDFQLPIVLLLVLSIPMLSCKKLIEVDAPSTSNNLDVVFSSDATAAAVMSGVFARINNGNTEAVALNFYPELSADNLELFFPNAALQLYFRNVLTNNQITMAPTNRGFWGVLYTTMYNVNSVIENVPDAKMLTKQVADQLMGEAYFTRAFLYFYLVNLYGDVPLVQTTNYDVSIKIKRTPAAEVYKAMVQDLIKAKELLKEDYVDGTLLKKIDDRLRPNKYAASALLARVYLYTGEYANAEAESSVVISKTAIYEPVALESAFLKASRETIWALQPVRLGENTVEGKWYIIPFNGPNSVNPAYLSDRLMNAFEANDKRKTTWISSVTVSGKTYPFPYKYKSATLNAPLTEYSVVLRLSEQYLIRAEARAQMNNTTGAAADLDVIRRKANLTGTTAATREDLLLAIFRERRVELFTEWGHRWLDMKRTKTADEIMSVVTPQKGGTWKTEWQLYPLLDSDVNNKILEQNPGYQ